VEWVCVLTALPRLTEFHMCGHVWLRFLLIVLWSWN